MPARIGWLDKPDAWVVSSWTFRQFMEDVLALYPDDPELAFELTAASRAKQLFIDDCDPDFIPRLADALRHTASAICTGQLQTSLTRKPYGTDGVVAEYRHALEKLVGVVGEQPDFAP